MHAVVSDPVSERRWKVLVIRFSSIGDIVLTTPVLRGLEEQLHAEIHYATKPAYVELLAPNPRIAHIHALDGTLWQLACRLRAERFDAIIDLHHNLRTQLLRLMLGFPRRMYAFRKLNFRKWLYVKFRWPKLPNVHVVDRYWHAAAPIGLKPDRGGLEHHLPNKQTPSAERLIPPAFRPYYIAVAIGAKWATKRLPLEQLIILCDRIAAPVVLLGGTEDAKVGRAIEAFFQPPNLDKTHAHKDIWHELLLREQRLEKLGKKTRVFNACGHFTLHESAAVLQGAAYVFSHDTAMMHIAAAYGKEIFSIWGNTIPAFGMYPYKSRFTVLEHTNLNCRPCSKIGYRRCPKGHFRCMKELSMDFFLPTHDF